MQLTSWNDRAPKDAHPHGGQSAEAPWGGLCESCEASGPCGSCEPLATFPSIRVREDHELVHVLTELPGVDAEELEISIEGTMLTLRGGRKADHGAVRVGRFVQRFLCRIELPSPVDRARAQAHLDMGVLTLTLPKLVCEPARTVKQG